jgi:uncharacterized phage-like protein YoqJ
MIVAGTGHRPDKLGGYGDDVYQKLVSLATDWLSDNLPTKVISGMAIGWDQALAQAAIDLQIPLVAAIPFKGQEDLWPEKSRIRYKEIMTKTSTVKTVCSGAYAGWKMQTRNEWMVDQCDMVLALWDGTSGGTGNCVRYAKKTNKPLINLWEQWSK